MLSDIPVPLFPFVPIAPGVPPLLRSVIDQSAPDLLQQAVGGTVQPLLTQMLSGAVPSMLNGYASVPYSSLLSAIQPGAPLTADDVDTATQPAGPQWGIANSDGQLVITPDSVRSFSWGGDYRVISYSIEDGNFETYNKVQEPYVPKVVMRKGGTLAERQAFIGDLDSIRQSLELYTVLTPEISYTDVTITHVDYDRKSDQGATVIEADIWLQQINVSSTTTFSNVAQPQAADGSNTGTVQTVTPTSQQATAASGGAG